MLLFEKYDVMSSIECHHFYVQNCLRRLVNRQFRLFVGRLMRYKQLVSSCLGLPVVGQRVRRYPCAVQSPERLTLLSWHRR